MNNLPVRMQNRWPGALIAFGFTEQQVRNIHQPCPGCGGTDRYRFDDKNGRGTFFCSGGGDWTAGDGFDLLRHVYGWDFAQASRELCRVMGWEYRQQKPVPGPRLLTQSDRDYMSCFVLAYRQGGATPTQAETLKYQKFVAELTRAGVSI